MVWKVLLLNQKLKPQRNLDALLASSPAAHPLQGVLKQATNSQLKSLSLEILKSKFIRSILFYLVSNRSICWHRTSKSKNESDASIKGDSKNKQSQGKEDKKKEGSDNEIQKVNSTIQDVNQAIMDNSRHSVKSDNILKQQKTSAKNGLQTN